MTDLPKMPGEPLPAAPSEPTMPPINIEISLPAEWSLLHWQTYANGAAEYNASVYEADGTPHELLSKYFGALALVKADLVHVTGLTELRAYIEKTNHDADRMALINLFVRCIANKIQESANRPLEASLSALLGTTVTVRVTSNQAP